MSIQYTVVRGDCLSLIAQRYGFADYRTIYNHPENAEFKRLRPDPNLIYPGDILSIPDRDPAGKPAGTEKKHVYRKKGETVNFRVVIKDEEENPYADKKYELKIDEKVLEGSTDGTGFLQQKIPADAAEGQLKVFIEEENLEVATWDVAFGHLDPHDTNEGAKGRLKNLNFYFGDVNNNIDEKTTASIKEFQKKHSIDDSGVLDDATRSKLQEKHDVKS